MSVITNVPQVKINVMTQSQFDVADKSSTELYMITDAEVLPSQTGQSGKFLTTDGTTASWANVSGSGSTDDVTIELNGDNELQVIGTINKNTETGATNPIYDWVGTLAEYQTQQIKTLHPEWLCYITDDLDASQGASNIDNSTITTNSEDKIQAVAVVNNNNSTGATNPIYDWVGTYEEYINNNIATVHPEYVCYITDDYNYEDKFRTEVAERNMGEVVYSTIPIADAGLHLANGDVLDGTGIYKSFYDYMVKIYNDGHISIFCTEDAWQTANTNYGKCGKYVLDTINQTIRLPKIPGFIEGILTESQIGDRTAPGLPNITGEMGSVVYCSAYNTNNPSMFGNGALSLVDRASLYNEYGHIRKSEGENKPAYGYNFNASRSSSIYGNSTTVQPESIKVYVYIVIANTTKTPIKVDIDEVVTDLNGKVSKGHELIAYQAPTSSNNYTWYRKYADGWVEQGGRVAGEGDTTLKQVSLPIQMADINYTVFTTPLTDSNAVSIDRYMAVPQLTTTSISIYVWSNISKLWQVSGMAA